MGALFFLSGASALVYQVSWQRILALHTGVGIYSIAMIVGAFMAGLGAGSHLGGVWSARVSKERALALFAAIEVGIAVFGAVSCALYYDLLYLRLGWLYEDPWRAGLLHFLGFLLPTGLMGMSLPYLVRAMVTDAKSASRTIGFLYGINMLGAAAGALVTPWVLVRFFGIRGAVFWAAAGNLLAGVLALVARRRILGGAREGAAGAEDEAVRERADPRPFGLWLALYALSGFCALSLEVLWFRMVDVGVKAMAFTFGTVLCLYLFFSAIGSLAGTRLVLRLKRPLHAFLLCQCLILGWSAATALLLAWLPAETPLLRWYLEYWQWYDGFKLGQTWNPRPLVLLYLVWPCFLYAVPTFLMGLSFPILQEAVHDDPKTSGRKVGFLQAANIGGCTAGSLLVGLVLLDRIGTTGTLRALVACGVVFALVGVRYYGVRSAFGLAAPLLAAATLAVPAPERFWLRLHGRTEGLVDEDATGVGTMTRHPVNREEWHLSVNGKGQGSIPFFEGHLVMGAAPVLVHPAPVDVMMIGLGTAGTAWAAGCREETRSVTVFELYAPQTRLLHRFLADHRLPALEGVLKDPRVDIRVADGRNALDHDDRLYDIIEADPIFPDRAYSGNLYSQEFYERCLRRLKPGGFMAGWAPSNRIYATFHKVFPHVVGLPNRTLLLGSREPIAVDLAAWQARLDSPAVRAYLGDDVAAAVARRFPKLQTLVRTGRRPVDINHDLSPRDEFLQPQ